MKLWLMVLCLTGLIISGSGCVSAQEESPLLGKKAPDFTLARIKGTSASLTELIKGKKAIVFFYASWCPHCRQQIDAISQRKEELKTEGIEFILVNVGESKSKVAKFLQDHRVEQDSFLDSDSFVAQTYQVMGIPTLIFIGADGLVRYVEYGLPDNYKQILK